jgi:hypothetical protein
MLRNALHEQMRSFDDECVQNTSIPQNLSRHVQCPMVFRFDMHGAVCDYVKSQVLRRRDSQPIRSLDDVSGAPLGDEYQIQNLASRKEGPVLSLDRTAISDMEFEEVPQQPVKPQQLRASSLDLVRLVCRNPVHVKNSV